jgi:hypothetical protein
MPANAGSNRVVDLAHVRFAHTVPEDGEFRERRFNLLNVSCCQLHAVCTEIFKQMCPVSRPGDGDNIWSLCKQPWPALRAYVPNLTLAHTYD